MTRNALAFFTAAFLASGGSAAADPITLSGTLRDFLPAAAPAGTYNGTVGQGHPDFEGPIGGLDDGAVQSTLGADSKPVFNAAGAGGSYAGAAAFNQWFNDTAGINLSKTLDITLTELDPVLNPGVYTYDNSDFFPIVDDELYGNVGANGTGTEARNFWFTYEIHTTFGYQPGQTFSFTGDDDLWVFIDGQLVMDLGGVHGAVGDTIDLQNVPGLNLVAGENYAMAIFFAERHTSQSNFKIETTIPFDAPTDLPVPEPTSLLLLGSGLVGLGRAARRSKQQQ